MAGYQVVNLPSGPDGAAELLGSLLLPQAEDMAMVTEAASSTANSRDARERLPFMYVPPFLSRLAKRFNDR